METIVVNEHNKFYINNQFLFSIKAVRKWLFSKDKYQIIDAFGNVLVVFLRKAWFRI